MKYSKYILEAINRGIKLALDDFEDNGDINQLSSKHDIIKDTEITKKAIDLHNNFIDLGLPSGTWWAKYNLGVDFKKYDMEFIPNWFGCYYAWGELEPKDDYNWTTYKFNPHNDNSKLIKYNYRDKLNNLLAQDDIVTKTYGNKFHIPTKEQCEELLMYTKVQYVENYDDFEGLKGFVLTANNGNSIFLPANGYISEYSDGDCGVNECNLWSNTVHHLDNIRGEYANSANTLFLKYDYGSTDYGIQLFNRCYGFGIRPVYERNKI